MRVRYEPGTIWNVAGYCNASRVCCFGIIFAILVLKRVGVFGALGF